MSWWSTWWTKKRNQGSQPPASSTEPSSESRDAERADAARERRSAAASEKPTPAEFDTWRVRDGDETAIQHGFAAASAHPGISDFLLHFSRVLDERGDPESALKLLSAALEAELAVERPSRGDEHFVSALMMRASLAERLQRRELALQSLEALLSIRFDHPQALPRYRRLRSDVPDERALQSSREARAAMTFVVDGAVGRGRYRVETEIGRGGAGTVFVAHDVHVDRKVALKVYHRRGQVQRERLHAEAHMAAQLVHPGVVRILDLEPALGAIAMEWVPHGSIRDALARGPTTLARATRWLETSLRALAFVHSKGIVHRDLKPSNLLIGDRDDVIITDFGSAAPAGADRSAAPMGEGTMQYMPPEQRAGAPAQPGHDMYAFGVSFREIFGGVPGLIPSWIERLLGRCAAERPINRASASTLLHELDAQRRDESVG